MEKSNKEVGESIFDTYERVLSDPKNQIRSIYDRFVKGFTETYNDPQTIGKQIIIHLDELDPKDAQTTAKHLIKQYGYYNASIPTSTFIFNQKGVDIEEWKRAKGTLNVILKDWINKQQQINNDIKAKENKKVTFSIYCKVGALFAQSRIEGYYKFDNKKYESLADVERAVQKELDIESSVRQYISDTVNNREGKNLLENNRRTKVIEYCKHYNIEITNPKFQ